MRSPLRLVQQLEQRFSLFGGDLEKGSHVTLGDHQAMPGRDQEGVTYPEGVIVVPDDARRRQVTKRA